VRSWKKIRSLRAYALTTELGVDDKTGGRLWPVLAKYDDEIDKLLQQRIDVNRRLKAADQIKDPRAQDRLVDEALANQKAFWSVEERRLAELRKILTASQMARLLVVLPRVRAQDPEPAPACDRTPGHAAAGCRSG
jgi:hypothetical protein